MGEFRKAMRQTMGRQISDEELDMIFMKVDTNCDGTVDWDEYLTYMLLECREKDQMNYMTKEKTLPRKVKLIQSCHKDSIVRIDFVPYSKHLAKGSANGRYVSVSKEGLISSWTMDMKSIINHSLEPCTSKNVTIWVTDVAIMGVSMLAIATTGRNLLFYDTSAQKFTKMSAITSLDACIVTLNYSYEPGVSRKSGTRAQPKLLWGDSRGGIGAIEFSQSPLQSVLHIANSKIYRKRIALQEILGHRINGITGYCFPQVHEDYVRMVRYYQSLECFISCCKGSDTSMYMGDLEQKKYSSYFKVMRGIYSFDYNRELNIIVTGGYDAVVRVWNPYVTSKAIILLRGHKSPILHVIINAVKEEIISISEQKEIFVHDLHTQVCTQMIFRKMIPMGPRQITATYFNQSHQMLIVGTNCLGFFKHKEKDIRSKLLLSHSKAVTCALYNPLFKQVVSGGHDSMVCVWDVCTGERVMQFSAHYYTSAEEVVEVEITAMTFDPTYRRLVTAGRDGTVKIWNFNNGACLRSMQPVENKEISGVVFAKHRLITAGWNRQVTEYIDHADDDSVHSFANKHNDDILSLAYYHPNIIATGSYDGDIIVWQLETRRMLCRLNARSGIIFCEQMSDTSTAICRRAGKNPIDRLLASREKPVDTLLFLQTRESEQSTAVLLASGADGWVRAWSIHHKGGLLGAFSAIHKAYSGVTSMATDCSNQYLLTGDTMGYVKVWDIQNYCISEKTPDSAKSRVHLKETFDYFLRWQNRSSKFVPLDSSLARPPLLNSFRGHIQSITSIEFVDEKDLIITGSTDASVRLWTLTGEYLGLFGQRYQWKGPDKWNLSQQTNKPLDDTASQPSRDIPPDVRKVASATTLRVLKGALAGHRWKVTKNVLKWIALYSQRKLAPNFPAVEAKGGQQMSLCQPALPTAGTTVKPNILGKSYQRTMRHHRLPSLPRPRQISTNVSVYCSLPLACDLDPIKQIEPPSFIVEREMKEVTEQEGRRGNQNSRQLWKNRYKRRKTRIFSGFGVQRKTLRGMSVVKTEGLTIRPIEVAKNSEYGKRDDLQAKTSGKNRAEPCAPEKLNQNQDAKFSRRMSNGKDRPFMRTDNELKTISEM